MSKQIAESRLKLVEHDKTSLDSSWVPWINGSCAAVRSGYKLTNATKCTRQTNGEMKHTTARSNPMTEMKVAGKSERIVPESGSKAESNKSRVNREIFVEPRGTLVNDIKYSWRSPERIEKPKIKNSNRSARWNKPVNDNRVDCRKTSRDDACKNADSQNCTHNSKKQVSVLSSVRELEDTCQSSSDCASTPSSFTVSSRSVANYFLKKQKPGPFKDQVNDKVHLNNSKYISETREKTDISSLSYPDNDSSTSDSGDSSGIASNKNKNMRCKKEIILDKNARENLKCLNDKSLKLTSIHSVVNGNRSDKQMTGTMCNGTGKTKGVVGDGVNSELLQEGVKRGTFIQPHSKILTEKETTLSKKKKSFPAEDGNCLDHNGEGEVLRDTAKEEEQIGVQMSRSVELGIDVLLFAISRFKNIIKRCSSDLPTGGIEGDKEEVLERCVNELSSKLRHVHENTTRLLVEVEEQSNLGKSAAASRPTISAKQKLDCLEEHRTNEKHLHESRGKVDSSYRPNTCYPSRNSRQYSPDTSTMIQQTKGR